MPCTDKKYEQIYCGTLEINISASCKWRWDVIWFSPPKYSELPYKVFSPKKEKMIKWMWSKRTSLTQISSTLPLKLHKSFNLSAHINILKSQQFSEMVEFGLCQWLGEYIHQVFISWYIFKCNFPVFNHFSDKVILDINVLGLCIKSVVLWQCNRPLVIAIDCN